MKDNPDLYEKYTMYNELFDIASKISNRVSNASIHAGGVVIGATSIDNYTAMDIGAKRNEQVLSLNKKKCQPLGLIKFDILGLSNLNIIKDTKALTNIDDWEIDINNPEFEYDKETFDLICAGKNDAIFQLESIDTAPLIRQIQPRTLADIGAITSIIRPDCAPMRVPYLDARVHHKPIEYIHPDMEKITGSTFGQVLYQEQTMNITRVFGGRSYAQADIFRKAISSKDKDLIKLESDKMFKEIIDNGYDANIAKSISDMLAKGGGYGFNNCLSGDTIIARLGDSFLTIAMMYKIKNNYEFEYGIGISRNESNKIVANKIVDIRYEGYREVFKVQTYSGRFIKCTDNHKFPTPSGEKMLSELKVKDLLYIDVKGVSFGTESIVSIEFAGFDNVYDVEMKAPYHNFVVNDGILTSNSHAMGYSAISMQTAYLKAHYPLQFFTALFKQMISNGTDGYSMLSRYINDARTNFGINVLPPNINKSSYDFTCDVETNSILFGLSAIKGLGDNAVNDLIAMKPYKNIVDFISKVDSVSTVVTLAKAGALPVKNKKEFLLKYARSIFKPSEFKPTKTISSPKTIKEKYNLDLYDIKDKEERLRLLNEVKEIEHKYKQEQKFSKHMENFISKYLDDEYMWEFNTLSMFITNDPLKESYKYIKSSTWDSIEENVNGVLLCVVTQIKRKKDKNGNTYACVDLYTPFGLIESKVWSHTLKQYGDLIIKGNTLAVLYKKRDGQAFVGQCRPYKEWLEEQEKSNR